jgi:hypothetical protein
VNERHDRTKEDHKVAGPGDWNCSHDTITSTK